jgi:hypothetical protein
MERVFRRTELSGRGMSVAVIGIVAVDLVLAPWLSHTFTLVLLLAAAVLPAAVASLNGIAFQSECRRLAERSEVMRKIIIGRLKQAENLDRRMASARENPDSDRGSWSLEVLRVSESIAADMVNEVAEWSVLYTNVIRDGG